MVLIPSMQMPLDSQFGLYYLSHGYGDDVYMLILVSSSSPVWLGAAESGIYGELLMKHINIEFV